MTRAFRLVGISGSLRKGSWNTQLLNAIATASRDAEFAQQRVQFEIADWSKLPVFNEDLEPDVPAPVLEFKKTLAAADGIIISTPEYNFSVPGGLKNAVDWASRSTFAGPSVWKDKPVGIVGVGPQDYEGAHGGLLAALALRQSGMALEWKMIDSVKLHISRASEKFTEGGELKQEETFVWQSIRDMIREIIRVGKIS